MARSRTQHEYNISTLNKLFGVFSVIMVIVVVGMVMDDYLRSWKQFQREFARMEREELIEAKTAAEEDVREDRLERARVALAEADSVLAEQEEEVSRINGELRIVNADLYVKDAEFRKYKAQYDVLKYDYYAAHESHDEAKAKRVATELAVMETELESKRIGKEEGQAAADELEAQLTELRKDVTRAEKRIDDYMGEIEDLEGKIAVSGPSLFNTLRNAPMMEFVQPSLKIHQLRPDGLSYSVNYGNTERVDRCTTCHLGIDLAKHADSPQPFAAHPNLDLFVGASSAHPMTDFGCTECHMGRPRGVEFSRVVHTPSSEEQEHEWHEEYGWHKLHHWDQPMLASQHVESGCFKCHSSERTIPGADRYNAGRELVEYFGCHSCHRIQGHEGMPKRGPNLKRVAEKVTPEFAFRWINDPKLVRKHTTMPRVFNLENVVGGIEGDETYWARRTQAEVNGIVAYLFEHSDRSGFGTDPVPAGNAENGRVLFDNLGCRACHLVGDEEDELDVLGVSPLQFGPNLEGVASKSSPGWIYAWIKDPGSYDETTAMPDLRLTNAESADITSYLMTLDAPEAERYRKGPSDPQIVETALEAYLSNTTPIATARAQLAELDEHEREVLLGEKVIARQGCYGCHLIEGFDEALEIGTDLSEEGSKTLHKFDFANQHDIPHTVPGWIKHKLLNPRSFDEGMHQTPLEKLRMPDFGMTEEQAELVLGNVLSWQKHTVPKGRQKQLSVAEQLVADGERLVTNRNCRGCHIVEGRGGAIAQYIEEQGFAPPNLANEGAKVQPEWLVRFLHEPSPIRPWLSVRMPTFGFDAEEMGTIANYFMAAAGAEKEPYPQADLAQYPSAAPGADHFTLYKCQQCHPTGASTSGEVSTSELAPNLGLAKERLRPDWIVSWLMDPQSQMPGTKMPSFFYEDGEYFFDEAAEHIEAIRDHLMTME